MWHFNAEMGLSVQAAIDLVTIFILLSAHLFIMEIKDIHVCRVQVKNKPRVYSWTVSTELKISITTIHVTMDKPGNYHDIFLVAIIACLISGRNFIMIFTIYLMSPRTRHWIIL